MREAGNLTALAAGELLDLSDHQDPVLSIGLPVFNGGAFLELSVKSVLNQSFKDWELLIIDDGSTDGAIDRLPCLSDRRVVLVRDGCNRGLAARLNQAVSMAKGRYFGRMDHDDICHPERFMRQIEFLERHPEVDLLGTRCVTMDDRNRLNGTLPAASEHVDICRFPWRSFYMPHPSWMGNISWFRKHYYQEPAPYCCEDQELLLRAHCSSCYHVLPQYLMAYRLRNYTNWKKTWRTHAAMLKMQMNYFVKSRQWISASFSLFANVLRIVRDGWRECRYRAGLTYAIKMDLPPEADAVAWQKYIVDLTADT